MEWARTRGRRVGSLFAHGRSYGQEDSTKAERVGIILSVAIFILSEDASPWLVR